MDWPKHCKSLKLLCLQPLNQKKTDFTFLKSTCFRPITWGIHRLVSKFSCRRHIKHLCISSEASLFVCVWLTEACWKFWNKRHFLFSMHTQSWSLPRTSQHWFTAFISDSADTYKMNNTSTHWIIECLIRISGIHRQFRVSSSPNLEVFRLW